MQQSVTFESPVSSNRCGYTARVSHSSPACVSAFHVCYICFCLCCLFLCLLWQLCVQPRVCCCGDICMFCSELPTQCCGCGNSEAKSLSLPLCFVSRTRGASCSFAKLSSVLQLKLSFSLSACTLHSRTSSENDTSQPAVCLSVVRNSNNTPLGAVRNDLRQVSASFLMRFLFISANGLHL